MFFLKNIFKAVKTCTSSRLSYKKVLIRKKLNVSSYKLKKSILSFEYVIFCFARFRKLSCQWSNYGTWGYFYIHIQSLEVLKSIFMFFVRNLFV